MYKRPGGLVKAMNGFMGSLGAMGLGPSKMARLEVAGRKSGQPRSVAVNVLELDGQRYLVAPRGNTEWVRNVKAAGGRAVLKRGKAKPFRLEEVAVEQRAPIIQAYLKKNAWATQREFGITPKASIEDFQRIAPDHPVFRINES